MAGNNVIQPGMYGTLAGNPLYGQYMLDARRAWEENLTVTAADVRMAYRRAGISLSTQITYLPGGASVLRRSHLDALHAAVKQTMNGVNDTVLEALTKGINLSVAQGSSGPHRMMRDLLGGTLKVDGIDAMFASTNKNAVLALLNRTRGPQGLNLSQSVWETTAQAQGALRGLVEGAVARGMDSRQLADQAAQFLQPSAANLRHRKATARRLGIRADLPYPAMRLARTELTNAFHEGTVMGNRATPSYEGIIWRLSQQHPVPDICDDLAQGQANDGSGFWPTEEEPNTPHAQCMCHKVPKHRDLDSLVDELQGWLQDPASEPKWEKWYEEKAKPFITLPPPATPPKPTGGKRATAPAQPKAPVAPKAKKAVKAQSFPEKVRARVAQGVHTDKDLIDVGRLVDEEWMATRSGALETTKRLRQEIDAGWKQVDDMRKKTPWHLMNQEEQAASDALENHIEELTKQHAKAVKAADKEDGEFILGALRRIRPTGLPKGEGINVAWNSDPALVKRLEVEAKHFPTTWWAHSQADGGMLVKSVNRGYYGHKGGTRVHSEIALSDAHRGSVEIHELGHRMERTVPRIVDMERQFFRRRTAGDRWEDVYPENTKRGAEEEWFKRDNWVEPYMGKEYFQASYKGGKWVHDVHNPPGESQAYELVSVGMEAIFKGTYPLVPGKWQDFVRVDHEYRQFILGMLAAL